MFMNYMDYVDDAAMFMFTPGQVARMQASLDMARSTIGHTKPGPIETIKFLDDHQTLKFRDDGGSLKFRDDPITLKFRDDIAKLPITDYPPGTFKFRDDVKLPTYDLPYKAPAVDVGWPQLPFHGDPAPFILATPHHSSAWRQSFPSAAAAADYEQRLIDYESLLSQLEESSEHLTEEQVVDANRVYQEYVELALEYRQAGGGAG
jgi:hypothetical protein